MGLEAECEARWKGKTSRGRALLETDEIIFRGGFRLRVPLKSISSVTASGGRLVLGFPDGPATFLMGPAAATWANKIENPKSRIDKLGVKRDQTVLLVGIQDRSFQAELDSRGAKVLGRTAKRVDAVFVGIADRRGLAKISDSARAIERNGAVWVVYAKGKETLTELDVLNAGRGAGLKDVKVVRFSDSHTALKFVVPLAQR